MDLFTTILIALGLAMDSFAVSVTTGLHVKEHRIKRGMIVAVSFAFMQVSIIAPVIIIAVITTALSLAGFFAGQKLGHIFENKIEIIGGLVLIGIGIKILVEHLM